MTGACAPEPAPVEPTNTVPSRLELIGAVQHDDELAYEPMVAEHPDGTLFVSGFGRIDDPKLPPQLWRSDDRGATWTRINVGTKEDGAIGDGILDVDDPVAR